jgi:predicted alpha/beta-hydrolase family hydrolase
MPERFHFDVDGEKLTAIVYPAVKPLGSTLLLGHGASAGQRDRFMVDYATGLAERGVLVVTYDFPFMEHGRRNPDSSDVLAACCRAATVAARQCRPKNRLFIGGKSLGGRIASEVAAAGGDEVDDLSGIVLLGYPLHPVGKRTALRWRHLLDLRVPALFVQGTRDVFGTPDDLRGLLSALPPNSEVHAVSGGDHSFTVSKRGPLTQSQVHAEIMDDVARWIAAVPSAAKAKARPKVKATQRVRARPQPSAARAASRVREGLRSLRRSTSA